MTTITRRIFLAAVAAAAAAEPATAAAAVRKQAALFRIPQDVQGQQGNASITVSLSPEQDVTAIRYTISNIGAAPDTFTVWYTDLDNGREGRRLAYPLDPGESARAEVYGHLNHTFLVNVCQSDGSCFSVGPIGPAAATAPRGLRAFPPR